MGSFNQIQHQKRAAAILQRAILADRVSHAWLFSGPSAADMQTLALAFAQTLQCTERPQGTADACRKCRSCRQAEGGNHPDLLVWSHEKPKTFSVEEVRALTADVSIRPFESERKIYIVPDAHLMRAEAQNALLKTLEEPPDYAVLILLTSSPDAMLETVRSRCQIVELAAEQAEYDPALLQAAEQILLHVRSWNLAQIRAAAKDLTQYKDQPDQILSLFTSWYRDVLYYKASKKSEGILAQAHASCIRSIAESLSFEEIQRILDNILTAMNRLKANVNFELTMELLLMILKDPAA